MDNNLIKVLLIEDNPGDARLLLEIFSESKTYKFEVITVTRLQQAIDFLSKDSFDVVLLDLSLPDSSGLDTFINLHKAYSLVPIVILTGLDDETVGINAVRLGAQDYLTKGHIDLPYLIKSILYAIERMRLLTEIEIMRKREQEELKALSYIDDLTGLYNRRGFYNLAEHQIKFADRIQKGLYIIFADIDNLKYINDTLGHIMGDKAIVEVSNILKSVFRKSDVIARIGGDEFAIVAISVSNESLSVIDKRLMESFKERNSCKDNKFNLSISVGGVYYDPKQQMTLEQLLAKADVMMYEQKRLKKNIPPI